MKQANHHDNNNIETIVMEKNDNNDADATLLADRFTAGIGQGRQ